jgi:hypothetical protein
MQRAMQSPNAVRRLRSIFLVAITSLLACADDSARVGPAATVAPVRTEPPAPAASAPPPPSTTSAPTIDVGGRVVDDLEQPVVGRPLVVVDRSGKRVEVMTDEEGGFHVMSIAPPYDLLVTQAPSGAVITPLVYLGLTRDNPRIEVFERYGPTERPASQPLRIGVKLPPCRATTGACWVAVVSTSASGRGGTAGSYTEGAQTAIYELDHAFQEAAPRAGESLDVHVLVGDAQYTQYAYAHLPHVPAHPGEPMDLGMTTPLPVPSGDPITIGGHASRLPDGWQWTLASELDVLGGGTIPLRYDWSPSSELRLPLLPGATWRVAAWAQHPPVEDRPYFHRSSQAWSGTLPLTATNVAIEVPLAPETTHPTLEGRLSRRGQGLAWLAPSPALASVVLVDLERGQQRFRAFTSAAEIGLHRLFALGLSPLDPGDHVFDLTTTPGANVDELTQPDERQRRRRFDVHVPGSTTYQRFRFQVTR